ncbi:hypothetical protein [Brevundimonas lenta]|uniref:Uncharacterized protein n=1 Tax=Brevundimonas lenta TaxID=424796 RepID=A0A7W6JDG5_9CAUL|nr:hypothetical protein [Brevundimonas lenta]MBB4083107.1 hypothetical protein [Brevundimonas lenta]
MFVALWVLGAAALLLGTDWLIEALFIVGSLLQLLWALAGLIVLIVLLLNRGWLPALALIVAAVGLVFSPLPQWGGWLWFRISFERNRPIYEQVVARAATLPAEGELDGAGYRIEPGPPVRIAFPQPVGVADNWGAVIHDPSDAVLTARGWGPAGGPDYTVRPDLQELWGGDLLSCTRITGHWHRCWFT